MSFTSPRGTSHPGLSDRFCLQRPVSIAIYDSYDDAQHAVDYLSDQHFPVQNLSIVGTDLKSFERITGGLTWAKVLGSAAMSGVVWGILAALFFWILFPGMQPLLLLLTSLVIFVAANMITSAIAYRMTGGRRDFTSTTQIIATHYEVLGEAGVADRARAMLSGNMPPQTNPAGSQPGPNPTGPSTWPAPSAGQQGTSPVPPSSWPAPQGQPVSDRPEPNPWPAPQQPAPSDTTPTSPAQPPSPNEGGTDPAAGSPGN